MAESHLPKDFLWGFATAAYQIEGAIHEDGREDSIWDSFCRKPGKIADGSSGEVACDSYRRTDQDIALLKSIGAKAYRFSLSWSRIIPLGGRHDPVNEKGIGHYVKFVDDLRAAGIEPLVTLYHWDLPDNLDKRYGGLLNKDEFVQDFTRYANVVFEAFADRVKFYITFNEPWCVAVHGYQKGIFAPGRTSDRSVNAEGDGSREPWIVGHNVLIAHAHAVKLYREVYKPRYGGTIAITLNGDWGEPWDANDPEDVAAVERKQEFFIGWFGDPVYFGDYPASMRERLQERLPSFTKEESALVKGSNDFYGMNHYCADYVRHIDGDPAPDDVTGSTELLKENKKGERIGPETQSTWLTPNPLGFRRLLNWISNRYGRPTIYVTENGTSLKGENDLPVDQLLEDEFRVQFFESYIAAMADAFTLDKVDVRGYMAWSLLDNFEWAEGYETRFGVTYVDYEHGQKRHPKKSAKMIGNMFDSLIRRE